MPDSLREQVARRLRKAYFLDSDESWANAEPHNWSPWLQQADEVIRLMEWASHHGKKKRVTTPLGVEGDLIDWKLDAPPLTLPPDDWRP